jgi:small redox-active disulfide protein 2
MVVKVLGTGCVNCRKLEKAAEMAVKNLGEEIPIEKISDMAEILSFGVMSTPALVVNNEVKISGMVPTVKEIETILQSAK